MNESTWVGAGRRGLWIAISIGCLVACSSSHDGAAAPPAGKKPGQSPAGSKPPGGSCKAGQKKACTGTKCADGTEPIASCASGQYAACVCGKTAAGGSAGSGVADRGGAGSGSAGKSGGGTGAPTTDAWPMMGYDTKNNYFNPTEKTISVDNAPMLKEKWRFTVAGYPPGSPAIAEGKVFVTATGGTYGVSLDDGHQLWARTDIVAWSSVAYADGAIYVHANGTMGSAMLYKLSAADGSTMWGPVKTYNHPSSDGTSSPIVSGDTVLVGHTTTAEIVGMGQAEARGGVEAFNIKDGSPAWTYYTVSGVDENGAMVWSTVSVDEDTGTVFAGAGNNYTLAGANSDAIHAINLADGSKKWVQQVRKGDTWTLSSAFGGGGGQDTDFGANPILAEIAGKKVVADGDKGASFWVLDRDTGEILWSRKDLSSSHNPQNGGVLMNGAFDGTYFFVVSNQPPGNSVLHALDPAQMGKDAWGPVMLGTTVWGAPSLANGVLVVPVGTALNLYDAKTGDMLSTFETGGTIAAGAAAIAGGRIVVKSGLQYPLDSSAKNNNLVICYGL